MALHTLLGGNGTIAMELIPILQSAGFADPPFFTKTETGGGS